MKKVLNKEELINEIIKMERGTVYTLNVLDEGKESVWTTFITKTRWFDNHIVVIGGTDDETIVSKNFDCDDSDINDVLEELINNFVSEFFDNKYNEFTLSNKSEITIQSNVASIGKRTYDNFQYI